MKTYDVLVRSDIDYDTIGTVQATSAGQAAARAARMATGSSNVNDCSYRECGSTIVVLDHRKRELCYAVEID